MARNFHVVSTCSNGNGNGAGKNALRARCSRTQKILADGVKQDGIVAGGEEVTEDEGALGFKPVEVGQRHRL